MAYSIYTKARGENNRSNQPHVVTDQANWSANYKDAFIEQHHDYSQLSLLLPDDCLVVAGPPRIESWDSNSEHTIGFVQGITVSQTSSVQPLKALGSRRHIFAKTNQPVQVQINRMIFTGSSLLTTLYASHQKVTSIRRNQHYDAGVYGTPWVYNAKGRLYTNIEDDLYRIPFGLMLYLNGPSLMGQRRNGDYRVLIEACTVQSHNMSVTSGEAFIMEQVSLMADRIVGFPSNAGNAKGNEENVVADNSDTGAVAGGVNNK